jgi:hypothetical protein
MLVNIFKYWFLNRFIHYLEEGTIANNHGQCSYHSLTLTEVPNIPPPPKKTHCLLIGTETNSALETRNNWIKTKAATYVYNLVRIFISVR